MVAQLGRGLAVCVELANGDAAAAGKAAAIAATAASAAWLSVPSLGSRTWLVYADAAEVPGAALGRTAPSKAKAGTCPLGFGSDDKGFDVRHLKSYTFQLKSIASVFDPWNLIKIYLKNLALVSLINVNVWLWDVMDAEEKALQEGTEAELPPFPPVQPLVSKASWSAVREVLTLFVRRCYEHILAAKLRARWAWKFLKDYRASLQRKALFYFDMPRLRRIPVYTVTIARATAVPYAADWTVSLGYQTLEALRSQDSRQARVQRWAGSIARQTVRSVATWAIVACSTATVVAFVPDQHVFQASGYCHFLFDLIVSNLIWGLMELEGGFGSLGGLLPGASRPGVRRGSFLGDDAGGAAHETLSSDLDVGGLSGGS